MDIEQSKKVLTTQKIFLVLVTLFLIVTTPQYWITAPDSGIYLATAKSLITSFEYNFNGMPNILYYPGTSALLTIPLSIFGENIWLLQGYMGVLSIFSVWLSKQYFSYEKYGLAGVLVPVFLVLCSGYLFLIFSLLSDGLFLTLSLLCLMLWRNYVKTNDNKFLVWCALLVALSPLVRFHGLFLCVALSWSLLIRVFYVDKSLRIQAFGLASIVTFFILIPFVVWTTRNYLAHNPDAFTVANTYFFGLKGLSNYAQGLVGNMDSSWVDADWKFPVYRSIFFLGGLAEFWVGPLSTDGKMMFTLVLLPILLAGIKSWVKRASSFEFIYIVISVLFILKGILTVKGLYVVPRHWVPLLPFVIVTFAFGFKNIINFSKLLKIKKALQAAVAVIIVSLVTVSSPNLIKHIEANERYENVAESMANLKAFSNENIPQDSRIATMDWGVLPHIMQRQSFPVLNDPSHEETIERILKYKTEYLVIHDSFPRTSGLSRNMVEKYSEAFDLKFETHMGVEFAQAQIYKVELEKLNELFNDDR